MSSSAEKTSHLQLNITDVYMKGAEIVVSDDFDPRTTDLDALSEQHYEYVQKSELLVDKSSTPEEMFLRVFIDVGFRTGYLPDEPSSKDAAISDFNELLRIKAKYIAEYQVDGQPSEQDVEEFALKASMYHVWPYWREYVAQSCRRAALGSVTIPLLRPGSFKQLADSPHEGDSQQHD